MANKPIYITRPILPSLEKIDFEWIWQSGWVTNNGEKAEELESVLENHFPGMDVTIVSSGTMALMIAFKALRLTGEVITTPFTFPATVHALEWCGLKPVFVDINNLSLNIDYAKIESAITSRTSAILPVHIFGNPCECEKIEDIAWKHGLKVVYDGAHTFGVKVNGVQLQKSGDATILSFHATKIFHTIEGGAIVSPEFSNVAYRSRLLRNFGIENEEKIPQVGINGKMSELHAAVGLEVLRWVDREIKARREVALEYEDLLGPGVSYQLPETGEWDITKNYQYFPIRIGYGARDAVFEALRKQEVYARKYFPDCSKFPAYRNERWFLPVTERVTDEILCLPIHGCLTGRDIERIATIVNTTIEACL